MGGMEAIRVDWLDGRGAKIVEEDGMEMEIRGDEWRSNGVRKEELDDDEDDNDARRKRRKGMPLSSNNNDRDDDDGGENADDRMLELTLSLVVASKAPSPTPQQSEKPASFAIDKNQNNYHHNGQSNHHHQSPQQQMGTIPVVGRHQSPSVKQLLHGPSSPHENQSGSSRANLTASLKHLVSQQQPVKVKTAAPRMLPAGVSPRHLPQYGASSPGSQLPRPLQGLVRASSSLSFPEGPEFQAVGRLASTAQSSVPQGSPGSLGQRSQSGGHLNFSVFPKSFPIQSQTQRSLSSNRIFSSRSAPPGVLHQSPQELAQHNQSGSPSQRTSPSAALARNFGASSAAANIATQGSNVSAAAPPLQALLQHQPSSNAAAIASMRQAGFSVLGKNVSAFSAVRPSVFSTVPTSVGDVTPRERPDDNYVTVNVCDRKVKLLSELDPCSLYALCRRWVRNDVFRRDQSLIRDGRPLPRPLSAGEHGANKSEAVNTSPKEECAELPEPIELISEEDLLRHHVEHYKSVRKRFKHDRKHRIARFMPRLALLLPPGNPENKREMFAGHLHL